MYGHTKHEEHVAEELRADGWQLVRQGWPDWACVKTDSDGRIVAVKFVEAKSGNQTLSHAQRLTFSVLEHIGFPVEVISDPAFYERNPREKYRRTKKPRLWTEFRRIIQNI